MNDLLIWSNPHLFSPFDNVNRPGYSACQTILWNLRGNELFRVGDQGYIAQWLVHSSLDTSTSVSTWMGNHQGRPDAENLAPFVLVDLNL